MGPLDGRIALVTGAGRRRGIGRGIVHELVRAGAAVAVHAREWGDDPWPLAELRGARVTLVEGDLTDRAVVPRIADVVGAQLGVVDVLVNNAGIAGGAGEHALLDVEDELWYRTVDVNLNAVYLVTKAFLRGMVDAGRGAVVNISSIAGRAGQPRMGAYVATKFALVGLTQQLALEYAPAVRVNCICPGSTDTDMMDGTFARRDAVAGAPPGTAKASRIASVPLGRQGDPHDIGRAVAFLASGDAGWITGQTLNSTAASGWTDWSFTRRARARACGRWGSRSVAGSDPRPRSHDGLRQEPRGDRAHPACAEPSALRQRRDAVGRVPHGPGGGRGGAAATAAQPADQPLVRAMVGRWQSNCVGDFFGGSIYVAARHGRHDDWSALETESAPALAAG